MSLLGFEITIPVLLFGAITGMTYGVLSVGLVLIYRSNRIINFAHGEIGAFGAALLGLVVTRWHVPYWAAFVLAIGTSAAVGAITEAAVVRRLRKAPALMAIVATLGVGQFLLLLSATVNSQVRAGNLYPRPTFLPEFRVGSLLVTRAHFGMLVLTPVLVAGLVIFLQRSRFGVALRGSAANPEAARMSGVFASRMSTLAWAIAGGVSAFTAVFVLPTQGIVSRESLGPHLLLSALVGAVIARMHSLPIALLAGLAVGIVEISVFWNYPSPGYVELILFLVVLAALLLQSRRGTREEEKRSWAAARPWRPLPETFRKVWAIRNLGWMASASALTIALMLTFVIPNNAAIVLAVIVSLALVGLSVGIVTGLGGHLSLGQFALAGIGGAASYFLISSTGHFLLGFIVAGLASAAVSVAIGLPALRIQGLMLAVTTLSFALMAREWLFRQPWMFSSGVIPTRPVVGSLVTDTGKKYYLFTLIFLALGLLFARNIWRSGLGRRLIALRDNETAARAFAVPATLVKLQGFALAGFLAGIGGAVYSHSLTKVSADMFPVETSINVVAMTVLGGIGILAGPLIGTLYIVGVPKFIPLDSAGLAASAFGWLMLILYFPGGVAQLLAPLRNRLVDWLARRAGLSTSMAHEEADFDADARIALGDAEPGARALSRTPPGAVLLEASRLSKRYGGVTAVDDVSIRIAPGEIVGIIGPNGAGKTTLFELLSGFTRPDEGSVGFAGKDISRLGPEARAKLGLVRSFQDAELFPTMTVLDVVKIALERQAPTRVVPSLVGSTTEERRKHDQAQQLVQLMGLESFKNKQISELSTGTRRITELACMVAMEPLVLLLDEPSSGIAQKETEALENLLARIKEYLDAALVVIEHDMPLIMGLADRIIAMESGQIIAEGKPKNVRDNPLVIESYLGGDVLAIQRSGVATRGGQGGMSVRDGTSKSNKVRCSGVTASGIQCQRSATTDGYCAQHLAFARRRD